MAHSDLKSSGPARDEFLKLERRIEELQRENEYFLSVLRNFRNGLLTVDNDLRVVFFNRTVERLLGYAADELLGMELHRLIQAEEEVVLDILHRGGLCVDPRTGQMGSFSFITKSGGVFPVEACFSVITDRNRQVCGMTCSFRDVTQKRRMERVKARIDRLASLGELASGMAHEIKNPLACIAGVVQNLPFSGSEVGPGAELVPEVLAQVEKIDSIINGLLHFAQPGTMKMVEFEVREVVEGALGQLADRLREHGVNLRRQYGEEAFRVKGDKTLLQRALFNLFMNACKALAEVAGERRLEVVFRRGRYADHGDPPPADRSQEYVDIEIRDNGSGIERDLLDSIFNPFFTTKYGGTGLGLATTHRILELHDGAITVESPGAVGTIFRVTLPLCRPLAPLDLSR